MKKILILLLFISLTSCLGSKKTAEKESITKEKESTSIIATGTEVTKLNGEIKDRIIINVPETDNKDLLEMFDKAMRQLNTSKSSGSNSYNSKYDEDTRQLVIDFIVGQTEDKIKDTTTDTKTDSSFEQEVTENTKKVIKIIPWWIWLIAGIWFLPQILSRVQLLLNPISLLIKNKKNGE
jgi:hypothetical protein